MDNLASVGNAFAQPFQGDRAAENMLKLSALIAPRLNFTGRPLQPGEGEGLRNVLGAFGGFAEMARRQKSGGQVMAGLQAALEGKRPFSSLPTSDLPEATQRIIMEQIAKDAQRQKPSVTDRLAAITHASQIAQQGGDPREAFRTLGLSSFFSEGGEPSAQPLPPAVTGAVSMRSGEDLAPSLNTLPRSSSSPTALFGPSEVTRKWQSPPSSTDELTARTIAGIPQEPSARLAALQRQKETPVTLAQSLNDAQARVQAEQNRLFGGVNSQMIRVPGMNEISVGDMLNLIGYADYAQNIEDRLAQLQLRQPVTLYGGLLPDDAILTQIKQDKSMRLKREATPQEVLKAYAKILIDRRQQPAAVPRSPQ